MNFFKTACILLILTFFTNCENKEKTNSLKMNLDVVIRENDSIQIYYTKNTSINFVEEQSFWKKIAGSKKNQTTV